MVGQPAITQAQSGNRFAWKVAARMVSWLPAWCAAIAVAASLAIAKLSAVGPGDPTLTPLLVAAIVPLGMGLQAALALSPESEPALELLLACPRPLAWVLVERLVLAAGAEAAIAVTGILAGSALFGGEAFYQILLRLLAPFIFLMGVAAFGTQTTRNGVYGTLLATLMWGGMLFGGDALLSRWPFLWPIHVYLQPEAVSPTVYAINRITLILAGLILTVLAAYLTRDEERMIGISSRMQ